MLIDFNLLFWKHNIHPTGILHLGSHEGQELEFYQKFCPDGLKVWIEAVPKIHARLLLKVTKHGHLAICACISEKDGETVRFKIASNEGQSSSMLDFAEHAKEHPDVRYVGEIQMITMRVDTLLNARNIQFPCGGFLNCDLQGCELPALRGMGAVLDQFDFIYCEYNEREMYKGCALEPELDAYLASRGFHAVDRFPTRHGWGDKLFNRIKGGTK